MSFGPRLLHVANGSSTTMSLEATDIGGALSIWADPLHDGPVPGGLSDDALLEVRAGFLSDPDVPVDPVNDMRRWRRVIDEHEAYDELVLWYEHDLFDQLNLAQLLPYIRAHVPAAKTVSLICIGSFPGRPRFKGLGELPFLAPALHRFLEDYPSTADGLSRSERRLLALASTRPLTLGAAFPCMHEDERYYITDTSLIELAQTLASTSPPLLTLGPGTGPFDTTIAVTDAGRDVLGRRLDRVSLGLDRWLGGLHLRTGGAMWRWDEAGDRVTSA